MHTRRMKSFASQWQFSQVTTSKLTYIHISSSLRWVWKPNLLLRYKSSVALFVFNKQNDASKTFVHPVSHLNGANFSECVLLASTAVVAAAAGKAEGGRWVGGWLELRHSSAFPRPSFSFFPNPTFVLTRLLICRLCHSAVVPPERISSSQTISLHNLAMLYTFCLC